VRLHRRGLSRKDPHAKQRSQHLQRPREQRTRVSSLRCKEQWLAALKAEGGNRQGRAMRELQGATVFQKASSFLEQGNGGDGCAFLKESGTLGL
jgi:hypothetical protein